MIDITLYMSEIDIQKNMLVDDLETYLEGLRLSTKHIVEPQYPKIALDTSLYVEANQGTVQTGLWNYCRIYDTDTSMIYYYFITAYEWSSQESVKLTLHMDTINTFLNKDNVATVFTPKTTIIRQHENRFVKSNVTNKWIRKVDIVDEGIHPMKYSASWEQIRDSKLESYSKNFYLIYRNSSSITPENQSQPVECFCVGDKPLKIAEGGGSGQDVTLDLTQFPSSQYLFFDSITNPQGEVTLQNDDTIKLQGNMCLVFQGLRLIARLVYDNNNGIYALAFENKNPILTNKLIFKNAKAIKVSNDYANALNDILSFSSYVIDAGTYKATEIISIDEVNKNDPFLIKIIRLPYAPDDFSVVNGLFKFNELRWVVDRGMLKLKNLSTEFENTIDKYSLREIEIIPPNITGKEFASAIYESKLYNSNFYTTKLVYDQFSYETPLELIDMEEAIQTSDFNFPVIFKPTNTINSNLLFKLDVNDFFFLSGFDFPNILISNRNNEITIYNSEYIKYINYGYNRDKERLGRQNAMNWVNTSLSLGSSILGMGVGINSGKIAGGMIATGGFTGVQSAITSIGSNIVSLIDNEASLAQKLDNAKLSGTSISGNNDNDLMAYYTEGNKLFKITQSISHEMERAIFKLFFYCGYARGYQGIPNFKSRIYFNYVQCNPVFTTEFTAQTKNEYIEDIINRFETGVTNYHKNQHNYDFEQKYENWEINLL